MSVPAYDHIVVVMMENHDYSEIIGNSQAPYINSLAASGALLTNYTAITHPSEPNYFALYAGSTFGVTDDNQHSEPDPTLDTILQAAGKTFTGYVEQPDSDFNHNPWESFPEGFTVEKDFSTFPTSNFASLPNVSFVIPNVNDDMHNGTIQQGDTWLKNNLDSYAQWAKANNSLLIVAWDEGDVSPNNQVAAIFYGAHVAPGSYSTAYNHYNLLSTILAAYGLTGPNNAATASPIEVFQSSTASPVLTAVTETPSSGDLGAGSKVAIALTTSEAVTVSGSPTLALNDGGTASYDGAKSTPTSLVFDYTVAPTDSSVASLAVASLNVPTGASIVDAAGNQLNPSLAGLSQTGPQISTAIPTITAVSETPSSGDLGAGSNVTIALTTSEAVTVSSSPTLALNDGGTASYDAAKSSPTSLVFDYTVAPSDSSVASLAVSSLNVPTGASIVDAAGNNLNPSLSGLSQAGPQIGTAIPTITAVSETPSSGDLNAGSNVTIALTTSEAVTVSGSPTLALNDGGTASYDAAKSTPTSLVFDYTVAPSDNSVASLAVSSLNLPAGASIVDAAGNNLSPSLAGLTQTGPQISTAIPAVTAVSETPSSGNLSAGSNVTIALTTSEAVTVSGSPTLSLNDGGSASYDAAKSSPTSLVFDYTVAPSDNSVASLAVSSVNVPAGASITDTAGNTLNPSLSGLPQTGPQITTGSAAPTTGLHYTPNGNIVNGQYLPGSDGFNLADVSSVDDLNSLPAGVKGLVWLGMTDGTTASFQSTVSQFIGNPKLFGFYLTDEPDPSLVSAANLKAESDWIHAHVPGAITFITLANMGSDTAPSYNNTYNSANTDIDLFGLNPYPVQTQFNGAKYGIISAAVSAAEAAGIKQTQIVPVYQAFGGVSGYILPTASQEQQILATWGSTVPKPAFDYAYSWGVQDGDMSLSGSAALQQVFAAHNAGTTTPIPSPSITAITETPSSGDLSAGNTVTIALTTSEAVTVSGSPTLALNDGGTANYDVAKSNSTSLVFDYTVASTDGSVPSLAVTSLNMPTGVSITDAAGNNLNLSLAGLTQTGPQISTAIPAVTAVSETPSSGNLSAGSNVTIALTTSEVVTVSGSPTLSLNDGGSASYDAAKSSPTSLVFDYTVAPSDNSVASLAVSSVNVPAGASITDAAGNSLNPSLSGLSQTGPQINPTATVADQDGSAEAPSLKVPSSLTVTASGSSPLGIIVGAVDADDNLSISISGVPSFESVTAGGATPTITQQRRLFTYTFNGLPAADWNNGLVLSSSYGGKRHPINTLTVTATNTASGEVATSPPATIAVTDPPASVGLGQPISSSNPSDLISQFTAHPSSNLNGGSKPGMTIGDSGRSTATIAGMISDFLRQADPAAVSGGAAGLSREELETAEQKAMLGFHDHG